MGNDLRTSNNELLKQIGNNLNLDAMYKQGRTDQQNQLKRIFTVIADNNVSKKEREDLLNTADNIKKKLDILEGKLTNLEEEIAQKEDAVNKLAEQIAALVTGINDKSTEMEKESHKHVKEVIKDVFKAYEAGNVKKDAISSEINIRLKGYTPKAQGEVKAKLLEMDGLKSEVDKYTAMAQRWIDEKNLLKEQYGVTKSAYVLISKTLDQIGNTDTSYQNSNYDTKIPVYSLTKTDIVSDLFMDTSLNVSSTNTNYGKQPEITQESITKKYSKYFADKTSKLSTAEAFQNLDKAIQAGMLEDMKKSNMTVAQIANFIATNYSKTNIKYDKDKGSLSLPFETAAAATTCNKLNSFINSISNKRFVKNTWDKDKGNTIDSNAQLAALAGNYEEIIDKLAKGDPAFSFKEGMYALFGEDGLFKNAGITYDLSKQDGKPSYVIDGAGDKETYEFYLKLAGKIKDVWGVDATFNEEGINSAVKGSLVDKIPRPPVNRDPITFETKDENGNRVENAFVIDRNKDGQFTDISEFVGGKYDKNNPDSPTWLDDLKTLDVDGDGKLTGDELKSLKILSSTYHDNAQNSGKMDVTQTDIDYRITNAFDMGIEEINLNDLESQVNKATGKKDINGSDLFEDSFTFKMNGKEMSASRKDDNMYFMGIVYQDATGKNFEIGHSESTVQKVIDESYGVMDNFEHSHEDIFNNLTFIQNYEQLRREAEQFYNQALDRMNTDSNSQKLEAANKAAALGQSSNWGSIQSQVMKIANDEGIAVDDNALEQMKGIYMRDNTVSSARQVVDTYKKQQKAIEDIEKQRDRSKIAVEAYIKCVKNGIKQATASEITKLLSSGDAKDVDDVVKILTEKYQPEAKKEEN